MVPGWRSPARPARVAHDGGWTRLEPLTLDRHGDELFAALCGASNDDLWTYIPLGPFAARAEFDDVMTIVDADDGFDMFAVIVDGHAVGVVAFLRCDPAAGSIEIGFVVFARSLQRTAAATEVVYLLAREVFDLGYRRFEWKCDALNEPSRRAASRFGFTYEGTFRQATVVKGRNRDTAWFSMLDSEWVDLRSEYERWLGPENFDASGSQRTRLGNERR